MEIPKEYDGRFINDEKLEEVVTDILTILEKWNLRTLEKQIVLKEVKESIIYVGSKNKSKAYIINYDKLILILEDIKEKMNEYDMTLFEDFLVLDQALYFIEQKIKNKIMESHLTTVNSTAKNFLNKLGFGD